MARIRAKEAREGFRSGGKDIMLAGERKREGGGMKMINLLQLMPRRSIIGGKTS
jgi:hypothetical protein